MRLFQKSSHARHHKRKQIISKVEHSCCVGPVCQTAVVARVMSGVSVQAGAEACKTQEAAWRCSHLSGAQLLLVCDAKSKVCCFCAAKPTCWAVRLRCKLLSHQPSSWKTAMLWLASPRTNVCPACACFLTPVPLFDDCHVSVSKCCRSTSIYICIYQVECSGGETWRAVGCY